MVISPTVRTFFVCLLALSCSQLIQTPSEVVQVYSVSLSMRDVDTPPAGSIAGGTTLFVRGAGFAPVGNIVTVGGFPCDPHDRIASPDLIVCDTVAPVDLALPDSGNLTGLMVTVNTPGKYPGNCSRSNCLFSYSKDATPTLTAVYPRSILPGQQLNVVGTHRVADKEDIASITVGGSVCARFFNRFGPIPANSSALINCTVNSATEGGYYGLSEKTLTGLADKHPRTRSWSAFQNSHYDVLVHPFVDAVSQSSGSPMGQTLVLTGGGFSRVPSRNSVIVGGTPCDVASSSETQIVCTTQVTNMTSNLFGKLPTNSTSQVNGSISGVGIRFKRYNISNLAVRTVDGLRAAIAANNGQAVELESGIATELRAAGDVGGNFARVYRGYFRPPMNGSYVFRALADDQIAMYMSSVTGSADTQFVNYSTPVLSSVSVNQSSSATNYFMMGDFSLQSVILGMNSSDVFYMEVWHLSGVSSGSMMMSAEVVRPTPSSQPVSSQGYDVFDLRVQPAQIAAEVLQFVHSGANGGTVNYRLTRMDVSGSVLYNVNRTVNWNATATEFNAMLNAFDTFQGFDARVTSTRRDAAGNDVDISGSSVASILYTVAVMRFRPDALRNQTFAITSSLTSLVGATASASELVAARQAHSPPMAGSFSLSLGNQSAFFLDAVTRSPVQNISLTVTGEQVREAFSRFYNCRWVDVDVSPNSTAADGLRFLISVFNCSTMNATLTANGVGLSGGVAGTVPQVTLTRLKNAADSIWFEPIGSEHLYTPATNGTALGQVLVLVNQAISVCRRDCSYSFTSAVVNVTSFTFDAVSGSMTLNMPVGSAVPAANYSVTLGGRPCVVDAANSNTTSISCSVSVANVQQLPTGDYWPILNVTGNGLVNVPTLLPPATINPNITSVYPSTIPRTGNVLLSLSGNGLPQTSAEALWTASLCGNSAQIVSSNGTYMTMLAPACPSNQSSTTLLLSWKTLARNSSVVFSNSTADTIKANYSTNTTSNQSVDLTALATALGAQTIISLSPARVSAASRVSIAIGGSGFGTNLAALRVLLVSSDQQTVLPMPVASINDTNLSVTFLGAPKGQYTVVVSNTTGPESPWINATWSNATNLSVLAVLSVSAVVNPLSSPFGGNKITVLGEGFSPFLEDNRVLLTVNSSTFPCAVVFSNSTNIDCMTPRIAPLTAANATLSVLSNGILADLPNPSPVVLYNSTALPWPTVTTVNLAPHLASQIYEVVGAGFFTPSSIPSIAFAGILGTVLDYTSHWLEYRIPSTLPAGVYPTVLNASGLSRSWNTTVGLAVRNLSRVNGSAAGDVVCLQGSGLLNVTDPYVTFRLLNGATPLPYFVDSYTPSSLCVWFALPSLLNNQTLTFSYSFQTQTFVFNYLTLSSSAPNMTIATASFSAGTANLTLTQANILTSSPSRVYLARLNASNSVIGVPGTLPFVVSGSSVVCNATALTAGQYSVYLYFTSFGLTLAGSVNVTGGTPTLASNLQSSWLGGKTITVTGSGLSNVSTLTVGGFAAPLVSSSASNMVFSSPPFLSAFTQGNYSAAPAEVRLSPFAITTPDFPERRSNLVDGRTTTEYSSSSATCSVIFDMTGPDCGFTLNRVRFFVPTTVADPILTYTGAKLSASSDQVTWTDLIAQVAGSAKNGWNEWRTLAPTAARYVRFLHTSVSGCRLGELEVYGQLRSSVAVVDIAATTNASAKFFDGVVSTTLLGLVQYSSLTTPNVTAFSVRYISPRTTTSISINGTGFGSVVADVLVSIDGVACTVTQVSSTQVNCTAQTRTVLPSVNSFSLTVAEQRAVVSCTPILYADRWSSNDTWGAKPAPRNGDNVTVPRGMVLLVDQSSPRLSQVYVEGTLAFDDSVPNLVLTTDGITLNGGTLMAGTPQTPYSGTLSIVLQNSTFNDPFPSPARGTIVCNACKMRMHGTSKISWAPLDSRSVVAGIASNQFVLSSAVNWSVGDEVVITTSLLDQASTERRTISSIDVTQKIINVTVPLQWPTRHIGNDVTNLPAGNITLSSQAGVLSRNIKIQGNAGFWATQTGARLLFQGTVNDGLEVKLSNIELLNCGHISNPRGYCMHFNMNGDMQGQFMRGVSIHDASSRLVTLAGVSYFTIDGIVGYNHIGHGIALQNGAEMNNLIQNNLILGTYPSYSNEESDTEPSSIWITHPTNTIINNVVGGSEADGISYDIKLRSDGESASPFVCPRGAPTSIQSNLAHSNKRAGLRVSKLYPSTLTCRPIVDPTLLNPWGLATLNPLSPITVSNITAHGNGFGVWIGDVAALSISNVQVADCSMAGIRVDSTNTSQNNITLTNANIVGQTASSNPGQTVGTPMFGLVTPRANWIQLTAVQLVNFASYMTAFQVCSDCHLASVQSLGAKYIYTSNVSYSNVLGPYVSWNGPAQYLNFLNADNTSTSPFNSDTRTVNQLVPYFPHNDVAGVCSNATTFASWNALVCSATPTNPVRTISIVSATSNDFNNPFQGAQMNIKLLSSATQNLAGPQTGVSSLGGISDFNRGNPRFGWSGQFVDGQTYAVWWNAGIDFRSLTIVPPSPAYADVAAPAIILRFNATEFREVYEVRRVILGVVQTPKIYHRTAPLNVNNCSMGDFYHDPLLQYVYLCVAGRGNVANNEFLVTNLPCHRTCANFRNDTTKEPFVRAWSNATQWPGGVVPSANSSAYVPSNWTLIVDVDTSALSNLTVDGDMLVYGRDTVITAQSIWIKNGSFSAGNSTSLLEPVLTFIINGTRTGANFTVASNITANKFFVVSGRLELYGPAPATTWTRLTAQLAANTTSMTVVSVADWAVGDDLVIAPSFANALEYERVTITAISGLNVTFTPASQFVHYGDSAGITWSGNTIDMRTAVGHVSRRIRIVRGVGNDTQLWGFRLLVTPVDTTRAPWANLRGVQFVEGGQTNAASPTNDSAAVHFYNTSSTPTSSGSIDSCSFTNCRGYCLRLENNSNTAITNNVFYEGRRFIVSVEGQTNYSFANNLMIGARVLPQYEPLNASAPLPDDVACYHQYKTLTNWATAANMVVDNLCQGSQLQGFVLPFTPCVSLTVLTTSFARNTAGTCAIGFLLNGNGSCLAAQTLRAYACSVGVMANPPNTTRLQYSGLMLADNKRGLTLRNGYLNSTGDSNVALVSSSWFSALSRPACNYCYGAAITGCTKLAGIRLLTSTMNGNLLPNSYGLSFDNASSLGAIDSVSYLNNVFFDNFQPNYTAPGTTSCSNNTAFEASITSDLVGSAVMTNCTGSPALNANSVIAFPAPAAELQCSNATCSATTNFFIRDESQGVFYVPGTNNISKNEANCTANAQLGGSVCSRNDIGVLEFESLASDNSSRTVWPVTVTFGNSTNSINAYRIWNYSSAVRFSRFNALIRTQQQVNLVFSGQPPVDMRFQLAKASELGNPSNWTIVNIAYPTMTGALSITVNGSVMTPLAASSSASIFASNSTCGMSKYFSVNSTLSLVLTGNSTCQVRVAMTSTLSMVTKINSDLGSFNTNGGASAFIQRLAESLGISPSRIIIQDLYEGSTIVNYQVTPDPSLSDPTAVLNNLNALSNSIQQGVNLGNLGPVISSSGVVSIINSDGSQVAQDSPAASVDPFAQTRIIIIAVVCSVVGAAGLAVGIYFLVKKLKASQAVSLKAQQITCQNSIEPKKASVKLEVIAERNGESATACAVVKPT